MNVFQSLNRSSHHFGGRPAIFFEERTITFRDLAWSVDRVAVGLSMLGVSAGSRVALFLPNIPEFSVAYYAAQKIGAITVTVNTMFTSDELHYLLADSGARVVFTTSKLLSRLAPLVDIDVSADHVIVCEGDVVGYAALENLGKEGAAPLRPVDLNRDAPAAILYTSGTTGKEKGATLSHGNVASNAHAARNELHIDPSDRLLLFLPLFHCFAQNFIMNTAVTSGAAIVLHRRFDLDAVLASIERDGVTMFFAVPTTYITLLNAGVDLQRLARVRYYFSAAARMPGEVAARWRDTFGRPVHEGYGLTETSPFACYNHSRVYRPGSVGTPIENVEMKVVDTDDCEVLPGSWGEIVIRGPNVMLGYWNRPEDTALALRDGWFHTGDIGYVDEDGYFFLIDRVKDMINSAGFKIWPRQVEEILYRHPAIKECAVVGIADPVRGEIAKAFVVAKPNTHLKVAELDAFCRQQLASYKVPRAFELRATLPKSATGKILKRALRDEAQTTPT